MILEGHLPPGRRINEVHLSERLGVSRTPLREALRSLVREGATTIQPRKGFFVRPLTAHELEQLYSLRPILDPEALRLAGLPGKGRLGILRRLNRRLRRERKAERIVTLDDEWHLELLADCPNRVLLEFIQQLMQRTRRYELALMQSRPDVQRAVEQHEEIIEALAAGQLSEACRRLKNNMQHGYEPILARLQQVEGEPLKQGKSAGTRRSRIRRLAQALAIIVVMFSTTLKIEADEAPTLRDLEGLWEATRSFDSDLRGVAIIEHERDRWTADLKGRTVTGAANGDRIVFDFGDGQLLDLRPAHDNQRTFGWWTQGRSPLHGTSFLTPIDFTEEAKGRLRGEIRPLDERMTFYLPISVTPDGSSATTYLCNPEQNAGRLLDVRRVELKDGEIRLLGFPFGSKEEEIVGRGPIDLENNTLSIYFARVGQGYEFQRVGPKQASDFFPRGRPNEKYHYAPPPERSDGWAVGNVGEAGISQEKIERFVQKLIEMPITGLNSPKIHALLVARRGKLVVEEYFHGFDRHTLHDTRSAAKSVTSTLYGAMIQAGFPLALNTGVYASFANKNEVAKLEPERRDLEARHLLAMSSGFFCDDGNENAPGNEDAMQHQRKQPDWYRFTLDLPMANPPGTNPVYCSVNANLLGGVMAHRSGRILQDLFRELLAQPLQIERYALNTQPTGEPYLGGGQYYEPRDFLKFGQLMLDGGTWHGHRIVSPDWAAAAVSPKVRIGNRDYGYLWWIQDYPYEDKTVRAFYAAGNGGQIVMVFPELSLVVGFLGGNYSESSLYLAQRKFIPEDILPAVLSAP